MIQKLIENSKILINLLTGIMQFEFSKNVLINMVSSRFIAFYSTAETLDTAYVFGGQGIDSNIVAQYNDDRWRRLDNLNNKRYGHGSIMVGDHALIVGGWARDQKKET